MRQEFFDALAHTRIALEEGTFQSVLEDSQDLSVVPVLFFPGCSFINSAPDLVKATERVLQDAQVCDGVSLVCCGKILDFAQGYAGVKAEFQQTLRQRLLAAGVQKIIVACPNCVAELRKVLRADAVTAHIEVVPLPRVLSESGIRVDGATVSDLLGLECANKSLPCRIVIHDSCPDRALGEFAQAVRELFPPEQLFEMEHNRKTSLCCGAVAQAKGREALAQDQTDTRINEAQEVAADALVTYCMSCSRGLGVRQNALPIHHYLEFVFSKSLAWAEVPEHVGFRLVFEGKKGVRIL